MNSEKGFTLIELLFAIFIFTIVISAVYGAYRSTFHTIQGSETILEESHRARAALERMTEDLTAIVSGPGGFFLGSEGDLEGKRADSLTFVSSSHVQLTPSDNLSGDTVIDYSAEFDEEDNSLRLMRSDAIIKPGNNEDTTSAIQYPLCEGLQQIRYTYFTKEGVETTQWETEVEREEDGEVKAPQLPAMVSIELVFTSSDNEEEGRVYKAAVALPQTEEK